MTSCPCSSGEPYSTCCKPFHDGKLPETALQLMRSRYSAYALDLPEYIIKTTHPKNPQFSNNYYTFKQSISQFSKETTFIRLDILESDEASVTFTAHLQQKGQDCSFTEKSAFEKVDGRWLYLSGEFIYQ